MSEKNIKLPSISVITSGTFQETSDPNLFNLTSIENDQYYRELNTIQSLKVGMYDLASFIPDDCGQKKARDVQVSQPAINFNAGHTGGKNGCLIDVDNKLRSETLTNKNNINQMYTRLVPTTPYVRGTYDVNVESTLQPGEKTDVHKSCNKLSGISLLSHYYVPMIDKLKKNIQNPNYLIPENSDESWVRGGQPTRQNMRNMDRKNNGE